MKQGNNKGLIFILVIIALLVAVWAYVKYAPKENANPPETMGTDKGKEADNKELDQEKDNSISEKGVDVRYPSFGNKRVDEDIAKKINSRISDFKSSLEGGVGDDTLEVAYSVEKYSDDIVSVKFDLLYGGGARPVTDIECLTYDLSKSKQLFLFDLFKPESEYLNKISGLAKDYLLRSSDKDAVIAGASPEADNFKNFVLTKDRIIFYFPACSVDACSSGPKSVPINYSDLSLFLNEGFYSVANIPVKESGLVVSLKEGDIIATPLELVGMVNGGGWICFEGIVGNVEIFDDNNNSIARGEMKASSNCLQERVDFEVSLPFKKPITTNGFVVFYNENPSGLDENNRQEIIRVRFK
jgi:hypothetical protein